MAIEGRHTLNQKVAAFIVAAACLCASGVALAKDQKKPVKPIHHNTSSPHVVPIKEVKKAAKVPSTAIVDPVPELPSSHIVYSHKANDLAVNKDKIEVLPPKHPDGKIFHIPKKDVVMVAMVCNAEAESLGHLGFYTCAGVILSRLATGHFGSTLTEVVSTGKFDVIQKFGGLHKLPSVSQEKIDLVYRVIDDRIPQHKDRTFGGILYFNNKEMSHDPFYVMTVVSDKDKNVHHHFYNGYNKKVVVPDVKFEVVGRSKPKIIPMLAEQTQECVSRNDGLKKNVLKNILNKKTLKNG